MGRFDNFKLKCGLEIHSLSDKEEKGWGALNLPTALLMPLTQSRLGWIGLCMAQNTMDEWPRADSEGDQWCHDYRSIWPAKIYYLTSQHLVAEFEQTFVFGNVHSPNHLEVWQLWSQLCDLAHSKLCIFPPCMYIQSLHCLQQSHWDLC